MGAGVEAGVEVRDGFDGFDEKLRHSLRKAHLGGSELKRSAECYIYVVP